MPLEPKQIEFHLDGLEKLSAEHQRRLAKLEARLTGMGDPMQAKELETKLAKLLEMIENTRASHGNLSEKVKQSIMMTAELAKPAGQVKMALAGIAALSKEVEALKKDQVSMADLKALEKRMLEAMKKAK